MKTRFPNDRRASWRDRFVAIARQADPAAAELAFERLPRPRIRALAARPTHRIRFA